VIDEKLKAAIIAVERSTEALHEAVASMLPPMPTGYLRAEQEWMVVWSAEQLAGDIEFEMSLKPPEGAIEFRCPTIDRLRYVQQALSCDHLHAAVIDGEIRYVAQWRRS
jgi:hypothetical protein